LILGAALARAQPLAPTSAASEDALTYTWLGPTLTAGLDAGAVGDALLGEVGLQAFSLRHDRAHWLLLWDALVAAKGGVLGNERPYTSMVGGRAAGAFEAGYRFREELGWSPYLSGRLAANLQVLGHPGLSLAELNTINDSDGVGGVTANGAVRVAGGFSLLERAHSVLLVAFVQEAFISPGTVRSGAAFTELGVGARIDLARSLTAGLEVFGGLAPVAHTQTLNLNSQTYHLEIGGFVRKTFGNGVWLSLALSWGRDSSRLEYLDTGTVYNSIQAASFAATLGVGIALWRLP
jgi:hypothetical protein